MGVDVQYPNIGLDVCYQDVFCREEIIFCDHHILLGDRDQARGHIFLGEFVERSCLRTVVGSGLFRNLCSGLLDAENIEVVVFHHLEGPISLQPPSASDIPSADLNLVWLLFGG